jgi:hypothetical protein
VNDVRQVTDDTLLALADHLPGEAAEALLELNRTTEHSYTQAASCESAASEFSAVLRASTAAVTSGV